MFRALITQPLTNALVAITALVPGNNLGTAIVVLTVLVRIVLLPLQLHTQRTQDRVRIMQPELKRIKHETKGNRDEEARRTLALYQTHRINPLISIVGLVIQIPIFIGLYSVFRHGVSIDSTLLYSFVSMPAHIGADFFGISLNTRSITLALIAGIIQFIYAQRALKNTPTPTTSQHDELSFGDAFNKSMHTQMRYFFPILITIISLSLPAAVALYWVVNSLILTLLVNVGKTSPQVQKVGTDGASLDQ